MRSFRTIVIACALFSFVFLGDAVLAGTQPRAILPTPESTGYAPVNGIRLWYGSYGSGQTVILLHGGITSSVSWRTQIPALRAHYHVIAIDSRGHGRSTRTKVPFTYDLMASDVLALMDYLHLEKAAIVGWSDGSDVGLALAIHHPERVSRLFAFAGNTDPAGLHKHWKMTPAIRAFLALSARQYHQISPTPNDFGVLVKSDEQMASGFPKYTERDLRSIHVPTWIAGADHDQFITRENTDYQAREIPGAAELILPGVTHGAPNEDGALFNAALLEFLGKRY